MGRGVGGDCRPRDYNRYLTNDGIKPKRFSRNAEITFQFRVQFQDAINQSMKTLSIGQLYSFQVHVKFFKPYISDL